MPAPAAMKRFPRQSGLPVIFLPTLISSNGLPFFQSIRTRTPTRPQGHGNAIMRENTRGQRWVIISFFMVIGLFFLYFVIFIARGAPDPAYNRYKRAYDSQSESVGIDGRIVLPKDVEQTVDGLRLTFRGISHGTINLDVVVVALDSQYPYRHRITVSDAKKDGLRLVDRTYRVVSLNGKTLRLEVDVP
jgi:hypothetical protein